jgi:DNA-binding MarR family transcriptional regulator
MKSNYLKYWRVVRKYVLYRYNISPSELELLLYLYSEDPFTRDQFRAFERTMSWTKNYLDVLIERGWVYKFREKKISRKITALYSLTPTTKRIITNLYAMLDADDMSVMNRWHVETTYKGKWREADNRYKEFMEKTVIETQRLQRRALESRSGDDHQ